MNPSHVAAPPFVIITPAHDEAAHMPRTVASMLAQTVRPAMWVVVDDNSCDGTAEVVRECAAGHDFIRVVQLRRGEGRHFGNKVHAFRAGLEQARSLAHAYVGNLDADISLEPHHFEHLLAAFEADPRLGIAGAMVHTRMGDRFVSQNVAGDSVAGAVQLFRRACFEDIGGYLALPLGGVDAAAEIMARMQGWRVRTLPDLRALEHRRTGTAQAGALASKFKQGRRLRSLGYGWRFLAVRCVYRALERPRIAGSLAMGLGFALAALRKEPIVLPPAVVRFLREEQRRKLATTLKGLAHVRHLRHL